MIFLEPKAGTKYSTVSQENTTLGPRSLAPRGAAVPAPCSPDLGLLAQAPKTSVGREGPQALRLCGMDFPHGRSEKLGWTGLAQPSLVPRPTQRGLRQAADGRAGRVQRETDGGAGPGPRSLTWITALLCLGPLATRPTLAALQLLCSVFCSPPRKVSAPTLARGERRLSEIPPNRVGQGHACVSVTSCCPVRACLLTPSLSE